MTMTYVKVGRIDSFSEEGRLVAEIAGREVAVFLLDGELVAYENRCPHIGGPVGSGQLVRRVIAREEPDGAIAEEFSTQRVLVCPWHGYEFDLTTGTCPGDPRVRLTSYEVKLESEDVYVGVPGPSRGARAAASPPT
jgi:nitrite reductase (NADH) small subunit